MVPNDENWETLLGSIRNGDEAAGARLVERLYPIVIRIVRNHLPRAMAEEDLAQEVFFKVFRHLDSFRGRQPLDHWVARIARNTCFDHLRKQKRRGEWRYADLREEDEEMLDGILSRDLAQETPVTVGPAETRELLERLLATLRPAEERVVRMLDLEELSVKEIGAQLGWGESRVKVTAFRARKKLRATLEQWDEGGRRHAEG